MKKVLAALAAIAFSGAIALAANIPLFTIVQPSNLVEGLNNLILQVNTGVSGNVVTVLGPVASTATTVEQTLATGVIPFLTTNGYVNTPGQSYRLTCAGTTAANTNSKTGHLYFGAAEYSTAAMSTSAESWELQIVVTMTATPSTSYWFGRGTTNTTVVAPVATGDTTDSFGANITTKCTVTQGTASASDTVLTNFIVEQIK